MHYYFAVFLIALFWLSIFEVAYSYVLYPILLRLFAWRLTRPCAVDAAYEPTVAVAVPVHNEEQVIARKLQNILAADYPSGKLSVWVGSDQSTDRTNEIVEAFQDSRVHLWNSPVRCGKAGILNALVPRMDADIVLFTDADIMMEPDGIRMLVRDFADPEVGGVGGVTLQRSATLAHSGETEESSYRNYEVKLKTLESGLHSTISAFGPFYAIRRALFVPYHPHTYSNDDVIMPMNIIRQGYRMYFDPHAISCEDAAPSIAVEFKRRVRIGAGNFQAFIWLLDFLNPKWGWPCFCYISHKVTRWFSPLFICCAAVCCGVLSFTSEYHLYKMLFISGLVVATSGIFHKLLPVRITRNAYYFMMMNIAVILGFFRFLAGIRTATWSRTKRRED